MLRRPARRLLTFEALRIRPDRSPLRHSGTLRRRDGGMELAMAFQVAAAATRPTNRQGARKVSGTSERLRAIEAVTTYSPISEPLNFSKVKIEYRAQKADGSLDKAISAGWDRKSNQKV